MYLTAHRVLALAAQEEGINAFYRVHGVNWQGVDATPAGAQSTLVEEHREITPGGNRVRSYLDIIAPDASNPRVIVADFQRFLTSSSPQKFPVVHLGGSARFELGLELSLAASWRAEAELLFHECLHVWMQSNRKMAAPT